MKACAIILAAGKGRRMNISGNKIFLKFGGHSALIRSIKAHTDTGIFDKIIVVCREEEKSVVRQKILRHIVHGDIEFVIGGKERQDSVYNALKTLCYNEDDIVSVHDAARCFVSEDIIKNCVLSAREKGSGVAGVRSVDTIKEVRGGKAVKTLNRDCIYTIQTPQAFKFGILKKAYEKAYADGFLGTDDASLAERCGEDVFIVEGSKENIKITTIEDIKIGNDMIKENTCNLRIGHGTDVHAFAKGRRLVLGGVEIPYEMGLDGHSDADVLVHAVMDAILGAAQLGDIGELFPPSDMKYKDISSIILLKKVRELFEEKGYELVNLDATLEMERPKILKYKEKMAENIAVALGVSQQYINIKATTTEGLGFVGRGEGAQATAVCLMIKKR